MTIIGIKELRTNTEEILQRVQAGESFTVLKYSKPVFNITPSSSIDLAETSEWTRGLIKKHRPAFEALADQ
ncbi:type II toxin-antitoxin system prevent-host-death family antitoxin [Candidatus Parcubacteria bacterium]|nr:type II toxin-antitoxin system prevent-host-death family antitoxin [Candidatus Parcubacteria bacterium]